MSVAREPSRAAHCAGSSDAAADAIAALAVRCLLLELETWPKPGLVSHVDAGSHDDMDAASFRQSACALAPYFAALAGSARRGEAMSDLRAIGLAAEAAMLAATGGANTHRGAIFGLGLLCAAAARRDGSSALPLGTVVARLWGSEIGRVPIGSDSHGALARQRYGAGGARRQAAEGFPAIYRIGVPALRLGRRVAPGDDEAARVQSCFALVATLDDTNLLYRGGAAGLSFAQNACRAFLRAGGVRRTDWRDAAATVHRAFVARRLSPGGSADMLAMTLFVDAFEGSGPAPARGLLMSEACP